MASPMANSATVSAHSHGSRRRATARNRVGLARFGIGRMYPGGGIPAMGYALEAKRLRPSGRCATKTAAREATMFKDGLFAGKRILVTGGGTGLGRAMAE